MPKGFQKQSLIKLILLTMITLGIYVPFWFLKQRKIAEKLSIKKKLYNKLIYIFIIVFIIRVLFFILDLSSGNLDIRTAYSFFNTLNAIILLVLAFNLRSVLEEYYKKNKVKKREFCRFWTFIFSYLYLQYRINEIIGSKKK